MLHFIKVSSTANIIVTTQIADEIWHAHYLDIIGQQQVDYMLSHFQSEAAITQQLANNHHYYLAKQTSHIMGYFAIIPNLETTSLQLSKLYIRQTQQGRGIGHQILSFIEAYCLKHNIKTIWLTVNRHNTTAICFYKKEGFKISDQLVQDIGGGFVMDDYKMRKSVMRG